MTFMGSDFDYNKKEFTSQAIGNRHKRYQKFTPIMKWEFQRDMIRMRSKIRDMKPAVDNKAPKKPSLAQVEKHRQEVEEGRLNLIEKENHALLERLRKIDDRPRSSFCHLKRRGDYLVKGDAFRLTPPSGRPLYLVQMYKKLKLANPMNARKSIRVQQEMLTNALDLVREVNKSQHLEEMVETIVQLTLTTIDEVPSSSFDSKEEQLSPIELVKLVNPNIDADAEALANFVIADMLPILNPTLEANAKPSELGKIKNLETSTTQTQSETIEVSSNEKQTYNANKIGLSLVQTSSENVDQTPQEMLNSH